MKPPRKAGIEFLAVADPLASLVTAAESGRLVALLRGQGLSRATVRELLRPESADRLKTILYERVFSTAESATEDRRRDPLRSEGGKVLLFRARVRETK